MTYADTIKDLFVRLDLVRQAPMAEEVTELLDNAIARASTALRLLEENVPEHVVTSADPSRDAVLDELRDLSRRATTLLDHVNMGPRVTELVDRYNDCLTWAIEEL